MAPEPSWWDEGKARSAYSFSSSATVSLSCFLICGCASHSDASLSGSFWDWWPLPGGHGPTTQQPPCPSHLTQLRPVTRFPPARIPRGLQTSWCEGGHIWAGPSSPNTQETREGGEGLHTRPSPGAQPAQLNPRLGSPQGASWLSTEPPKDLGSSPVCTLLPELLLQRHGWETPNSLACWGCRRSWRAAESSLQDSPPQGTPRWQRPAPGAVFTEHVAV